MQATTNGPNPNFPAKKALNAKKMFIQIWAQK